MTISLIVAHDANRLIGANNKLPWHIPNDLKYFKMVTDNKIVVMGKNTFKSIGKPLSNRINVILTRDKSFLYDGCFVFDSIKKLLKNIDVEEEIFIIGGSTVYSQFISIADKLYVTYIDHELQGDSYFPDYNTEFELTSETKGERNETNNYDYYFRIYTKRMLGNK